MRRVNSCFWHLAFCGLAGSARPSETRPKARRGSSVSRRPRFHGYDGHRELGEYCFRVQPFKREFRICRDIVDTRWPDIFIGKDVSSTIVGRDLNLCTLSLCAVVGYTARDSGEAIPCGLRSQLKKSEVRYPAFRSRRLRPCQLM
jgi:hypothetical protein